MFNASEFEAHALRQKQALADISDLMQDLGPRLRPTLATLTKLRALDEALADLDTGNTRFLVPDPDKGAPPPVISSTLISEFEEFLQAWESANGL